MNFYVRLDNGSLVGPFSLEKAIQDYGDDCVVIADERVSVDEARKGLGRSDDLSVRGGRSAASCLGVLAVLISLAGIGIIVLGYLVNVGGPSKYLPAYYFSTTGLPAFFVSSVVSFCALVAGSSRPVFPGR